MKLFSKMNGVNEDEDVSENVHAYWVLMENVSALLDNIGVFRCLECMLVFIVYHTGV